MAVKCDVKDQDELTELALRAGQGDKTAMDELLPIVMSEAKWNATRHLWPGNYEDVEDLTQDIMYAFLKGLPSFTGKAKFNTWFHRLAHNIAVQNYRKTIAKCRVKSVDTEQPISYSPNLDDSPDYRQFIKLCTTNQRMVLLLILQGYEFNEVANELGIDYEAARSLYRRGIKRLQKGV